MSDGFRRRASLCGLMFAPRPTGITPLCGVFPVGGALIKQKPFAVQKCFFHFPSACKRACAEGNEKAVLLSRTAFCFFGGEGGIRTPGTSQFNGFQDRRNRPLCHLSVCNWDAKICIFSNGAKILGSAGKVFV